VTLLDERVQQHGIYPWPYEPAFDRIIVWMLPEESAERDTFAKGGVIVKPDAVKSSQMRATARGVLVAAGLQARDQLRGHGIDLGHIVWVTRLSPWRHVVDVVDGREVEFMFLRAGDIVGSEDVLARIREGKYEVTCDTATGEHAVVMDDAALPRFDPPAFNA
jgi:hypothetical protein